MVTRRRLSPPSDDYSNEIHTMAKSVPRQEQEQQQQARMPLHHATNSNNTTNTAQCCLNDDDDEDDYYFDPNDLEDRQKDSSSPPPGGICSESPTAHSSSSSSCRSGPASYGDDQNLSPLTPVIGDVIHIPNHNAERLSRDFPCMTKTETGSRCTPTRIVIVKNSPPCPNPQPLLKRASSSRRERSHGSINNFHNSSSSSSSSTGLVLSPFLIGLFMIGLVAIFLSHSSVGYAIQKASELKDNRDQLALKLSKTEQDLQGLKREMMALHALMHHQQELDDQRNDHQQRELEKSHALQELNTIQQRIQDLSNNDMALQKRVQAISRSAVESKYGTGQHYVEMELVFPSVVDASGRHLKQYEAGKPTKFIIEMAPISEMPHSVHVFLEMVSAGLIDGCSFILNALHVLKAAPLPYDGSLATAKAKAFSDHGLEGVAFKEYSDNFPHLQYTMGFAADGSPSFYINTQDNSDIHIGDPCFGRIVDGLDAIQRLEAAPTRNGIWYVQKIGIKRARILSEAEYNPNSRSQSLRQHHSQQDPDQSEADTAAAGPDVVGASADGTVASSGGVRNHQN